MITDEQIKKPPMAVIRLSIRATKPGFCFLQKHAQNKISHEERQQKRYFSSTTRSV